MLVSRRWSALASILLAAAAGCNDGRSVSSHRDAVISDAVHASGTPGFFFLFPMVPPPRYTGTFRRALQPVVRIEELAPGTRGTIATYTTSGGPHGVKVVELGESYNVLWPTALFALNAAYTYRIHVSIGGFELGFADVDVVRRLKELMTVDTGEYVPLLDDLVLPIRFRVESDALKCVGVACPPADECHGAGTCDVRTGLCSSPTKPDGTACDDRNACTASDTCQGGSCVGASPVTCFAADQCHGPGTCDPATGICSNPPLADGTACDDLDGCTRADTCAAGVCVGSETVTCAASDQCHAAGTCDALTGLCSDPPVPDGTACNDGSLCTLADACVGGSCIGAVPVVCTEADQCHLPGVCDPVTGTCSSPSKADGAPCSDGNACTLADACQAGACVASQAVSCTALDACHEAGDCTPATGLCTNPAKTIPSCGPPVPPARLEAGSVIEVVTGTIGPEGGTLVAPQGSFLDGVVVVVPPGALATATGLTLGYDDGMLTTYYGEWDGTIVTLTSSGATEFARAVHITVPVHGLGDQIVLPFYATPDGILHVMAIADLDLAASTLTFKTFHATPFLVGNFDTTTTDTTLRQLPSTFRPEADGFPVGNPRDLPIEPDGLCGGMATFSAWYFESRHQAGEEHFADKYRGRTFTDESGAQTSVAQEIAYLAQIQAKQKLAGFLEDTRAHPPTGLQQDVFDAIKHALNTTRYPVPITLFQADMSKTAHEVLAFGVDDSEETISIYDPNAPGDTRYLRYDRDNKRFRSYRGGLLDYLDPAGAVVFTTVDFDQAVFGLDGTMGSLDAVFSRILADADRGFVDRYSISGTVIGDVSSGMRVLVCPLDRRAGHATCLSDPVPVAPDGSGHFSATDLADGAYRVWPSWPGHTYSPAVSSVAVAGASLVGARFTEVFTASGVVSDASGAPIPGVYVSLCEDAGGTCAATGRAELMTTTAAGRFEFGALPGATYLITPYKEAVSFDPRSRSITLDRNRSDLDFRTTGVLAVDLGTLGGPLSWARGINRDGAVTGTSHTADGGSRAFLWTRAGGMIDLGTSAGQNSDGRAISDTGQVVGCSDDGTYSSAFSWTASGGMVDLGPRFFSSCANAVNSEGQIAGWAFTAEGNQVATVWSPESGMIFLGTLPGGSTSEATGINAHGVVVGFSEVSVSGARTTHVFEWTAAGGMVDLGPPTGPAEASAINDSGLVVGRRGYPDTWPFYRAFLWGPSRGWVDLGGREVGELDPFAIDAAGRVFGRSISYDGFVSSACYWTTSGTLVNLGSGYGESIAFGVNASGQVVGLAGQSAATAHATLWEIGPP